MLKQVIMRKIYNEIDNIPPIPKHITKIRAMINNPNSDINSISDLVKLDAGLTANILRVSNSAWYIAGSLLKQLKEQSP